MLVARIQFEAIVGFTIILEYYLRVIGSLWLLLWLGAVVWAIVESSKRVLTVLWIVVSLASVTGTLYVCSLIWPFGAAIFAHLVLPLGEVISAAVGIEHMRRHKRGSAPSA